MIQFAPHKDQGQQIGRLVVIYHTRDTCPARICWCL